MAIILNTSFPGANANPIGGIWTTTASHGAVQQVSNQAEAAVNGSACSCIDTTNTYPNDHYIVVTTATWIAGAAIACYVRGTPASDAFVSWTATVGNVSTTLGWRTNSSTSGTLSTTALSIAAAAGDIFELDAQGQVYTCFHTPVSTGIRYQVLSVNDSGAHLTAGSIGFGFTTFTVVGNATIANITAGNFVTSSKLSLMNSNTGGF